MKKIFLLVALLLAFFSVLSAQITQEEADGIVLNHISQQEILLYIAHAKEDQQTEMTITTINGEELELDYSCWVYYIRYYDLLVGGMPVSRYLIVNASNGNVLDIKANNDTGPSDLASWREVEQVGVDSLEMGLYVESYGTEIVFLDEENLVIIGRTEGGEHYKYEIQGNAIKLTLDGAGTPWVSYFRIINSRKFAIEYLYAYPALGIPPSPMIFEKKIITPVLIGEGELYGAGSEGINKQNMVITDPTEWNNLLNAMNSVNNESRNFSETEIDFNSYQVIALFDEIHRNGGWTIGITDITEYQDKIVVTIENLEKGDDSRAITQPYHIVKIPVFDKPIDFNDLTDDRIVPFEEYSLAGTSCQWVNFRFDEAIVINDNEELENYLLCRDGSYPEIDFENYSLIYVNSVAANSPVDVIKKQLQQISDDEYILHLDIRSGPLTTPGIYIGAIKVTKLPQNIIITLNIVEIY